MSLTQSTLTFPADPIPPVAPCARCRTLAGYCLPGDIPRRFAAAKFGLPGKVCDRCRQILARELAKCPSDPAADSWADESGERAMRRDSRRLVAAYALKLAGVEGLTCREAWRFVRMRIECGDIQLPANV